MPASLRLGVFDLVIRVDLDETFSDEEIRLIRESWSRCLLDGTEDGADSSSLPIDALAGESEDAPAEVYAGAHRLRSATVTVEGSSAEPSQVSSVNLGQFEEALTSTITLAAINERVGGSIMLHATGLADPETGSAAVLVAPSGTGKTTAARCLGRTFSYLTDETVYIAGGRILPYPKPLSIIKDVSDPKHQVSPDSIGLQPTLEGTRPKFLAVLRRLESVDAPGGVETRRLSALEALHLIIPQTSGAPSLKSPFRDILDLFDLTRGVYLLTYSRAEDLEPIVEKMLKAESRAGFHPQYSAIPALICSEYPDPPAESESTVYLRVHPRDAVILDDQLLVMQEDRMIQVSDLGQSIWCGLSEWKTLSEIVDEVVEIHGDHPEAEKLVADALKDMEERGLLTRFAGGPAS